jgi:hypothetical protein
MEFSGQYLTYEEYRSLGGTLDLTPFNLLEFEARRKIDSRTMNRLKDIDSQDIPQEVKICEYNVINSINSYVNTFESANKNIASENIDGYSVSYVNPTQISEVVNSKNAELDDIITTYLFGVVVNNEHIIYMGLK